ncbi:hypothetical protein K502DRAFT_273987, partial [Neoconidiobolus thromboides FSU 785]
SLLAVTSLFLNSISSHVTANPAVGLAGSYFVTFIRVPHGCGTSGTTKVTVNLTDDLTTGATAQSVSGWKVSYGYPNDKQGSTNSTEGESGGASKVPNSVTWEAQNNAELPHDQFMDFGLSLKLPLTATYNNTIYFPTMQYCKNGTGDWSSWPGNPGQNPEKTPAPKLVLTNSTDSTASKTG